MGKRPFQQKMITHYHFARLTSDAYYCNDGAKHLKIENHIIVITN